MDFSVFFFSSDSSSNLNPTYDLLKKAVSFADKSGFTAVWTPERHFDCFGGAFPNPAVLSAALAMLTERIELRAGSLISPLHDVIRMVEEWAVVDNLSNGRVALSFGSGWNVNDFVFFPDRYSDRQRINLEQMDRIGRSIHFPQVANLRSRHCNRTLTGPLVWPKVAEKLFLVHQIKPD